MTLVALQFLCPSLATFRESYIRIIELGAKRNSRSIIQEYAFRRILAVRALLEKHMLRQPKRIASCKLRAMMDCFVMCVWRTENTKVNWMVNYSRATMWRCINLQTWNAILDTVVYEWYFVTVIELQSWCENMLRFESFYMNLEICASSVFNVSAKNCDMPAAFTTRSWWKRRIMPMEAPVILMIL